jgi:hypothetical protein
VKDHYHEHILFRWILTQDSDLALFLEMDKLFYIKPPLALTNFFSYSLKINPCRQPTNRS